MKNFTVFVALILLTACQSYKLGMEKRGATTQELAQISYNCQKDSTYRESNVNVDSYSGNANSSMNVNQDLYHACLRANGITLKRCPADAKRTDDNRCTLLY